MQKRKRPKIDLKTRDFEKTFIKWTKNKEHIRFAIRFYIGLPTRDESYWMRYYNVIGFSWGFYPEKVHHVHFKWGVKNV